MTAAQQQYLAAVVASTLIVVLGVLFNPWLSTSVLLAALAAAAVLIFGMIRSGSPRGPIFVILAALLIASLPMSALVAVPAALVVGVVALARGSATNEV